MFLVMAVTVLLNAYSLYTIQRNPYTYPSSFWLMLGLGALAYLIYFIYEVNLLGKETDAELVQSMRYGALALVNVVSLYILFTTQVRYAYVNTVTVNTIVLLNGFGLAMAAVHAILFVGNKRNNMVSTPVSTATNARSSSVPRTTTTTSTTTSLPPPPPPPLSRPPSPPPPLSPMVTAVQPESVPLDTEEFWEGFVEGAGEEEEEGEGEEVEQEDFTEQEHFEYGVEQDEGEEPWDTAGLEYAF
jgi:lipid-A-disaccharide synthase-like uncharacterized protein